MAPEEEAVVLDRSHRQARSCRPGKPSAEAAVAAEAVDRAALLEVALRPDTYALLAAAALSRRPQVRPSRRAKTEAVSFSSPFF